MVLKSSAWPVALALVTVVIGTATPAAALDPVAGLAFVKVFLPYANRSASFERAIRRAHELDFRRPAGDTAPLDEWASEITMVSQDGAWRVRLEEGTVEQGERSAYAASCTISSTRASARELADLGRRAFRDPRYWSTPANNPWRWDRHSAYPDEYGLAVEVSEQPGERPTMTVTGSYY